MIGDQVICPYCKAVAEFKSTKIIYGGRDFGMAYICKNYPACDSYVGVHRGTKTPLGRMADSELRMWKKAAHSIFDPRWKGKKKSRGSQYAWLADQLGIAMNDCHIGMFDIDMCKKVIEVCKKDKS